ncbi:TPA_asm: movement protein [Cardamom polerovirus]|uniref:Movement protein n=1 Tax=Cardamom polerovirus TaxID=2754871 RepID=A0AAD2KQV3_9VIRU|nr:TPA_asm: movement protein [Cardamom polerovirus]
MDDHVGDAAITKHGDNKSWWLHNQDLSEGIEEDEIETLEEEADLEDDSQARSLYFQRTVSKVMPLGTSPSVRVYQSVNHFQAEYFRPTMNIRSQWSKSNLSLKPPPRQPALSLTNWIPTLDSLNLNQRSISSDSRKMGSAASVPGKSMALSGTPIQKTNSGSSGKAMDRRVHWPGLSFSRYL